MSGQTRNREEEGKKKKKIVSCKCLTKTKNGAISSDTINKEENKNSIKIVN